MNTSAQIPGRTDPASGAARAFLERKVQTTRGDISFRECGQGPATVLLLHGISSGAKSWEQCALALSSKARVIAWNAPGYGASSPLDVNRPLADDYALSIAALSEALNLDACFVVGHSLGALMAAAYSAMPRHRATGFLLLSPALGYHSDKRKTAADSIRSSRFHALETLGIEGMAVNLPARVLSAGATDIQRALVIDNARQLLPQGYKQAVEMLCQEDIDRFGLAHYMQTCVLCGELDVVTTPEQSHAYATRHGFEFGLIPSAGHACYVEQPDYVAAQIAAALTRSIG